MTPDQARALLDGTTPGPWKWRWDTGLISVVDVEEEPVATDLDVQDSDLIAAAPALAAMIAGMRVEWSRQALISGDPEWHPIRWCRSREEAERTYWTRSLPSGATVEYRIVPRYIIEPETTNE